MFNINQNKISTIRDNTTNKQDTDNWLKHTRVTNNIELSHQYAHICQQHKEDKKWVLFINPEESSIEQLAQIHDIDVAKILMVNYKNSDKTRSKINVAQVKTVLSKGNCSAVILSGTEFNQDEVAQLEYFADQGKTQCVIIKKQTLH